jgi:hypothetical protein
MAPSMRAERIVGNIALTDHFWDDDLRMERHIILLIHGIRTQGDWQEYLAHFGGLIWITLSY